MNGTDGGKRDPKTQALAGELLWLGRHYYELPKDVWLLGFNVKAPSGEDGEWMLVLKGIVAGEAVVAFITAPELDVAVHLAASKLANGSVKWRQDKPYGRE